jgi:light-regulated signal transduction histidine kinase (bacteriophytochrome)
LPEDATEYMDFIITGVKRLESLLLALLEYTTIVVENPEVVRSVKIPDILAQVRQNLDLSIQEKQALIHYSDDMPALRMHDYHLLQLFQSLMSNAIKFCDTQPIINIAHTFTDTDIVLSINDNGIGMKKEYSDKIFLLFQRLIKTPQYESAGIGLTICKNIVDKYEGRIWFDSIEGEGTTFFIAFSKDFVE